MAGKRQREFDEFKRLRSSTVIELWVNGCDEWDAAMRRIAAGEIRIFAIAVTGPGCRYKLLYKKLKEPAAQPDLI